MNPYKLWYFESWTHYNRWRLVIGVVVQRTNRLSADKSTPETQTTLTVSEKGLLTFYMFKSNVITEEAGLDCRK